ncbi:hypothetical protein GSI_03206 [Ganoderma sinense ZZ0214-1]|uniref:Uncharacterized protein n=1 Tax=Ganoderma sinense ZZ0214-1 TaxID=1077348 RepID=A0A2G8SKZ2_9APHY|nr:hypothetical protein GSI_03206 [Ganoderma sinense ZZ0214-1]
MADSFPVDVAQLVALFMESILYGIFLVSFGMCMYVMLVKTRSRRQGKRIVFFIVALLLFVFATLDVSIQLRHVLYAFIWYRGPGGAIGEFSDLSYWLNAMKSVTYNAQTSIADGMLIYRCYIVYNGRWIIVVPLCVLWVAGAVVEGFNCYIEFTLHENALLNTSRLAPFITSTVSITLVLNIIATSLIVYKIWSIERRSRIAFASHDASAGYNNTTALRRAMHIVIESGLMYTLSVVIVFVVFLASNNAQYAVSDCVVQIIGIAFNLIIIRIDQGTTAEATFVSETERSGFDKPTRKRSKLRFRLSDRQAATSGTSGSTTGVGVDEGDYAGQDDGIGMMAFKLDVDIPSRPLGHHEPVVFTAAPV